MSFSMLTLVTALGWVGAVAGLVAYAMATQGRWTPGSLPFQVANLTAATLMLVVSAVNGVWPAAASNVAWIVIGAQALVTIARERRRAGDETVERPEPEPEHESVITLRRPDDVEPAVEPRAVDLAA